MARVLADGAKGVLKAVANLNKSIAPKLEGKSPQAQKEAADLMRKLDWTETKAKLGANAILGVSMTLCCCSMPASGNCMGQGQRAVCAGTGAEQMKAGSACRSERIAQYIRLLAIERELG